MLLLTEKSDSGDVTVPYTFTFRDVILYALGSMYTCVYMDIIFRPVASQPDSTLRDEKVWLLLRGVLRAAYIIGHVTWCPLCIHELCVPPITLLPGLY